MTIAERLKEKLEFDEKDAHRQAMLMGFDSNRHNEHKAFEYGSRSENSRLAAILARLVECVEAMQSSVARSDDYGDSHCSQPIRQALSALAKELGE